MAKTPNCHQCKSEYTYNDRDMIICTQCAYEWNENEILSNQNIINDSNGNELNDGDTVVVIQDLKVKGSTTIKKGTRVKNIKLIHNPSDGHDIDCRIDGFGRMQLKSEFVKKN